MARPDDKRGRLESAGNFVQVLAQRAFFEQLAAGAGYALDWQELDAQPNIAVSDAIMRGDPDPMRRMLDELIRDQ